MTDIVKPQDGHKDKKKNIGYKVLVKTEYRLVFKSPSTGLHNLAISSLFWLLRRGQHWSKPVSFWIIFFVGNQRRLSLNSDCRGFRTAAIVFISDWEYIGAAGADIIMPDHP